MLNPKHVRRGGAVVPSAIVALALSTSAWAQAVPDTSEAGAGQTAAQAGQSAKPSEGQKPPPPDRSRNNPRGSIWKWS